MFYDDVTEEEVDKQHDEAAGSQSNPWDDFSQGATRSATPPETAPGHELQPYLTRVRQLIAALQAKIDATTDVYEQAAYQEEIGKLLRQEKDLLARIAATPKETAAEKRAADLALWDQKRQITAEAKALAAEGSAQRAWQSGESGTQRSWQATQNDLNRQLQYYQTDLSNQIARGQLTLQQAQAAFGQALQNAQLRLQRQQTAGSLYGQANQQVLQGAEWAAAPGQKYHTGFGPKEAMAQLSKLLGAKFTPLEIQRIRFDPRGDVERILGGAYDWPAIAQTIQMGAGGPVGVSSIPGPGGGGARAGGGTPGGGAAGGGGGGIPAPGTYGYGPAGSDEALAGRVPPIPGPALPSTNPDVNWQVSAARGDLIPPPPQPVAGPTSLAQVIAEEEEYRRQQAQVPTPMSVGSF